MANKDVNNVNEVEEGLTFKDILHMIKKYLIVILALVIGCSACGYVYSKLKAPVYKANSTILVQYEGQEINSAITTEYSYSKYISDTLVVFMKEDIVLQKVVDMARADGLYADSTLTDDQLISSIASRMSVANDNLILRVGYTDSDPDRAITINNYIGQAAQEVADSVDTNGNATYHLLKDNLKVLSPARKANVVSSTVKNVVIFFAIGCVLAFIYVLLKETFDKSFKSGSDIERTLGIPVIAAIPDYDMDTIGGNK